MNFKKFFGIIFAAFVFVFTLTACIFTATDYNRQPGEQGGLGFQPTPSWLDGDGIRMITDAGRATHNTTHPPFFNVNQHSAINIDDIDRDDLFINVPRGVATDDNLAHIVTFFVPKITEDTTASFFNNINYLAEHSDHLNLNLPLDQFEEILRERIFIGRFEGLRYTRLYNQKGDLNLLELDETRMNATNQWGVQLSSLAHVYLRFFEHLQMTEPEFMDSHYIYFFVTYPITFRGSNNHVFSMSLCARTTAYLLGATHFLGNTANINNASELLSLFLTHERIRNHGFSFVDEIPAESDNGHEPTDPEIPGTDEDQDNGDIPGEPNEPEEPGTDEDQDNGDNGYEPTPEIAHLSWWEQFFAWLRRQLFVQN